MSSSGVQFPLDKEGNRSTSGVNQSAFAAAVERCSKQHADAVRNTKSWRFGYAQHVVKQVELACDSTEYALNIAKDGLDYLHSTMTFERDGKELPMREAMKTIKCVANYETATIKGSKTFKFYNPQVPYNGDVLSGDALSIQIDSWVRKGVIEMSTGMAMQNVISNSSTWCDLRDTIVVLAGAGSAMGPFPLLMAMGCTVIALDLPRKGIWERLIKITRDSPGTILIPCKKDKLNGVAVAKASDEEVAEAGGCDIIVETPEVRDWLMTLEPNKRLIFGAYAYLDGPLFVRVSIAMDAIIESLCEKRMEKIGIAYLCTPTDAMVAPAACREQANTEYKRSTMWQHMYAMISSILMPKKALTKNVRKPVVTIDPITGEDQELYIVDATVPDQGPNYILAKRLQHWRAILSRSKGHLVSTNIAPASATASVVSNKLFALAYAGMHNFKPLEVFEGSTSNAVMAMLLVNDIKNVNSVANPARELKNPMQLFSENSFHGGAWRCGWKFATVGIPSALFNIYEKYMVFYYLLAYNLVQLLGWSYIFCMLILHLINPNLPNEKVWSSPLGIGQWVTLFQSLMGLDVVHAMLGFVRSGWLTTALQIGSRVILCVVSDYSKGPQHSIFQALMITAWSITEVVRYAFFLTSQLKIPNFPLKWCRYTFFIVLYPAGVTGELGTIYYAMKDILLYKGGDPFLGFVQAILTGFGFIGMLTVYFFGLGFLYSHMFMARKSALLPGGKKKSNDISSIAKKKQ